MVAIPGWKACSLMLSRSSGIREQCLVGRRADADDGGASSALASISIQRGDYS